MTIMNFLFVIIYISVLVTCSLSLKVKRGSGPKTKSLSSLEIEVIVRKHNQLRASVSSSNMRLMTWDSELSLIAQNYGRKCQFSHNTEGQHSLFKNSIGENIYVATTGPTLNFDASRAIQLWFDEKPYFTYSTRTCKEGEKCGHYTQVVWADTYKVGCSLTMCDDVTGFKKNSHLFICNYSPAGNVYSQEEDGSWAMTTPFLQGPACSRCKTSSDSCQENLCANSIRDQDISGNGSNNPSSTNNDSCSGLIAAVVLLSLAFVALLAYTIYRQRVLLSLKYQGWGSKTTTSHAKFSNQNTPQTSRSNTPRPSIVGSTLHGTTKTYLDNKGNLLTPSPLITKSSEAEKYKKQTKDLGRRPPNSPSRPMRPPPPQTTKD